MKTAKNRLILNLAKQALINSKIARGITLKQFEKMLYKQVAEKEDPRSSKNADLIKYYGGRALTRSVLRNLDENYLSKESIKKLIDTVLESAVYQGNNRKETMQAYKNEHGIDPPFFITFAPTNKCNLRCTGCYASAKAVDAETLDWDTVDKIMHETHDKMGMRFYVISGGEPMMYQSEGKTILDLPRQWRDSYFLMYTNGTLISESVAGEMAKLGNITPAISVEGYEEQTDARRGTGIYRQILKAMSNLRNAGVMFGASVTGTKNNADILLEDEFYEYYFDNMRTSYMLLFQYMPIGRKFTTELMITPEQRLALFKKWRHLLSEKQMFIADFWNTP